MSATKCRNCGGTGEVFYYAQAYSANPVSDCNECGGTGKVAAQAHPRVLACPFCGVEPMIQKWHGSGRHSTLISCDNDDCDVQPACHGQSKGQAIAGWNRRVPSANEGAKP